MIMESDSPVKNAPDDSAQSNNIAPKQNQEEPASAKDPESTAGRATLPENADVARPGEESDTPESPVAKVLFSEAHGDEAFEEDRSDPGKTITLNDIKSSIDEMDGNFDDALGQAADSIWSFATTVTGKVTTAVKEGQPSLENLRKNVTSRLAPLDTISRDISSQIGALAPNQESFATITGSVKSVAATVQRNAEAMEAAILAKANGGDVANAGVTDREQLVDENSDMVMQDPMVLLPVGSAGVSGVDAKIDVNEEIAKVGETISNVGQSVGGLFTGLWGNFAGGDEEEDEPAEENIPKNRFEQRIFQLQANPDTYCEPAKDLDAFEEWSKSFNLDDNADECITILDIHEPIADLYEKVVPRMVDEDSFWMRYFFARHMLEQEEERRKRLLERAENAVVAENNDEDGWGDDDWDDELPVNSESEKAKSSSAGAAAVQETGSSSTTEEKAENTPAESEAVGDAPAESSAPETKKHDKKNPIQPVSDTTAKSSDAPVLSADTSMKSSAAQKTTEESVDAWGDDDWE